MSAITPPPPSEPAAPTPVVTICPECHRRATAPLSPFKAAALILTLLYGAIIAFDMPFPGRYAAFNHRNVRLDTWTGECVYSRDGQNYTIMSSTPGRDTSVFEPGW